MTAKKMLIKKFLLLLAIPVLIVLAVFATARSFEDSNATYAVPVYVTQSGECYHAEDCRMIHGKQVTCIPIYQASWSSWNRRPCSVCQPDEQDTDTIRFSDPAKAKRNAIILIACVCAELLFVYYTKIALWFVELAECVKAVASDRKRSRKRERIK